MLNELFNYLKKPELYEQSTCKFWDDEHISKGMLEAHLHPDWEAASRPHNFIDKSVQWISEIAPPATHKKLLDLGCGPGLYADRLYEKGYEVTGIDFSKRSINYAKDKAREKQQDINYIYKNYLEIDYENEFDLATLIYCDYAVLSDMCREVLLNKIYKALRPGGKFIFDVFTFKEYANRKKSNTWYVSEGSSFWRANKHICLSSHYIYEGDIRLDQYVIIDENEKVDVIRNWFKWFTKETITKELKKAGFDKFHIYSDVAGEAYSEESKTICIVAEK